MHKDWNVHEALRRNPVFECLQTYIGFPRYRAFFETTIPLLQIGNWGGIPIAYCRMQKYRNGPRVMRHDFLAPPASEMAS